MAAAVQLQPSRILQIWVTASNATWVACTTDHPATLERERKRVERLYGRDHVELREKYATN